MCPKCCFRSSCRGKTSKLLENLDVSRGRSKNNTDFEGGLYPPFQDPATSYKIPNSHKLLCQSSQEQLPVRGITSAYRQECDGISSQSNFPRVFQPTFSGAQTKQQMETDLGSEQSESFPKNGEIQDGNTRDHQNLPPTRRVGNLSRLQGCLLPYSNTGTDQEISRISCPGSDIPVQSSAFWSVHSPYGVHCDSKGGKLMAIHKGIRIHQYLDDWLVRATSPQTCLKHTQTLVKMCPDLGWLVNLEKSELEPKQVFDFVGYRFDLRSGRVRPTPDRWESLQGKIQELLVLPTCPVRQFMSLIGLLTATEKQVYLGRLHETNSVAPQKQLESTGIVRKVHSGSKITPPTLKMVARRKQCSTRSTITPYKTCPANLYRRIKRRVGRSLKRAHCKRVLVGTRELIAHKLPGTQSSFSSLKRVPKLLYRSNGFGSNGQH